MRREKRRGPGLEGLIALVLFGAFAVSVLGVLLTGAEAYRRLRERDEISYGERTCVQYIATRVRQGDLAGGVRVEEFHGLPCLALHEELDGESYVTRVYCYGGSLRELYTAAEESCAPEDGEAVLAAESLRLALEDGLLTFTVRTAEGGESGLSLSVRSWEGAE